MKSYNKPSAPIYNDASVEKIVEVTSIEHIRKNLDLELDRNDSNLNRLLEALSRLEGPSKGMEESEEGNIKKPAEGHIDILIEKLEIFSTLNDTFGRLMNRLERYI